MFGKYKFITTLLIAMPMASHAAVSPKTDELKQIEADLNSAKKASDELGKKTEQTNKTVTTLQKDMAELAARVREKEENLDMMEDDMRSLSKELTTRNAELEEKRKAISATIGAMIRLSNRPSAAILAMPGELHDTFIASSTLSSITGNLKMRSEALKDKIDEIEALSEKLAAKKQLIAKDMRDLKNEQANLDKKIDERSEELSKYNAELKKNQEKVQELSRKSGSLKELISKLEQERQADEKEEKQAKIIEKAAPKTPVNIASYVLPVAGKIIAGYSSKVDGSAGLKGIRIRTRDAAKVTSPASGEVAFTGPFMSYGKILIIRHDNGYHSLLSGLKKINVSSGQRLVQGEPVGEMGAVSDSSNELYVEVRSRNKPVDPAVLLNRNSASAE